LANRRVWNAQRLFSRPQLALPPRRDQPRTSRA